METVVAVCLATRQRPVMLAQALSSLAEVAVPKDCRLVFIVVENDVETRSQSVVNDALRHFPEGSLKYFHEPKVGIPIARNRAIEAALNESARLIAFFDDDEVADPDWLTQIVDRKRESGASLVGGPVRVAEANLSTLSWTERWLHQGLVAKCRRGEKLARRRVLQGKEKRIAISTNNWLAEADLFEQHGLSFRPHSPFSSGSDIQFFLEVRDRLRLKTAWAAEAVVCETIPRDRLTLSYQFRRATSQSLAEVNRNVLNGNHRLSNTVIGGAARCLTIAGHTLLLPFLRGDSLLRIVLRAGWIWGRVQSLRGRRSNLYETVTGS